MNIRFIFPIIFLYLTDTTVIAADYEVKMLDYGDSGSMVFEPDFLHIQPGDTVRFIPTSSGHNTHSYLVPESAQSWASKVGEVYEITFENQGVYIYYCPPHLMMGMVGVIQVGAAVNKNQVEHKAPQLSSKIVLNPQRLSKALQKISVKPQP